MENLRAQVHATRNRRGYKRPDSKRFPVRLVASAGGSRSCAAVRLAGHARDDLKYAGSAGLWLALLAA